MTVVWQKIRLPLLERLALADLAERRGQSEEYTLAQLVREAVKAELANNASAEVELPREVPHVDAPRD